MATDNTTIAGRIYLSGTNDFQQRVPDPTIAGIDATSKFLFDPMNRRYLNEFIDSFVNRIGTQIVHNKQWENPLAVFKGASMRFGSSIQEAAPKWLKAHSYNMDATICDLIDRPEFAVWYHTLNRQDRYDTEVQIDDLENAFLTENGLNQVIDSILTAPRNSANYDEYLCMVNQIAYYEKNWGFFKHHLSALPTDEATGKEFLRAVRSYAYKLPNPTSLYSPVSSQHGIPVFAKPNELVLFITADAMAAIDVETLAGVFQLDKADIAYRTIILPELPVPNACALLTTDQFFVVRDKVNAMDSFYDGASRMQKYFLHCWQVVSVSPFVPAILFTTDDATDVKTITQAVNGVEISAAENTIAPGGSTKLTVELIGDITENGYGIEVEPDAVTWSVSGDTAASDGEPLDLNGRTHIDRLGVLHVQKSGLSKGNVLHVTGTTSYANPSGPTEEFTDTVDITIK